VPLRARIVAAAAVLTTETGWSEVTMARLAERVGVSRQTVYNEIGSKPALAEAMIRAFMFADATAAEESRMVALHVGAMLTRAMRGGGHPDGAAVSEADSNEKDEAGLEQERAIVKVLSDVWLSSLVQWVTGRASAADVSSSLQTAVRLLLR
jgi:AcrR family transcriptional regulator